MFKKILCITLLVVAISSTFIFAGTQGQWQFDTVYIRNNITKVAGETLTWGGPTDPFGSTGAGDWAYVNLKDYTAKYIPAFIPLINLGTISPPAAALAFSPNMQLAESYIEESYIVNATYWVSDALSIRANVPFLKNTLTYSDGYIAAMTAINTAAEAGAFSVNGLTGANFNIPPKTAQANGLGDIDLMINYELNDNLTLGLGGSAGFLLTGKGSSEVATVTDNVEELTTGADGDTYRANISYITPIGAFTLIYTMTQPGYTKILDANFEFDSGDSLVLDYTAIVEVLPAVKIGTSLIYATKSKDKKKVTGGSWTEITGTDSPKLTHYLIVAYNISESVELFANYSYTLGPKAEGGAYVYPGRLESSGVVYFGSKIKI